MFCDNCGYHLGEIIGLFCEECGTSLFPRNLTETELLSQNNNEQEIIEKYFNDGYDYNMINTILAKRHRINMSLRTLKRRLQVYGLKRNQNVSNEALKEIMRREVQGSSSRLGYRGMWNLLRVSYGIRTPRNVVMRMLKELDPVATEERRSRQLKRRRYKSGGPNDTWHADGYDKLKPYGLPIHGAVDGFSRKILWLKVCKSNNNPFNPACFFVEAVKEFGFCPNLLRTDAGTENGIMASIQCALRGNTAVHKYGPSIANQD